MTDLKTPWINDREYPEYVYDDDGDCVHEFRTKEIGEFVVHAVNTIAEQCNNPDSAPAITVGQLRELIAEMESEIENVTHWMPLPEPPKQ